MLQWEFRANKSPPKEMKYALARSFARPLYVNLLMKRAALQQVIWRINK
jgi:hypothetical protein